MWSFYFVILDFLNEILPWRNSKYTLIYKNDDHIDNVKDEVRDIKLKSMKNPEKYLWTTTTKKITQVKDIFNHIKSLDYDDKPKYCFISHKLQEILATYNLTQCPPPVIF